MLDRIEAYADCLREAGRWAVATVAAVSGSVPRPIGTSMAVRDDGTVIGSISAGCVESAVVDAALTTIAEGRGRLASFGYDDDDGLGVGLMCGGNLQVLIQPMVELEPALHAVWAERDAHLRWAVVRRLRDEPGRPVLLDPANVTATELDLIVGPGAGMLVEQVRRAGVQKLAIPPRDRRPGTATRLLLETRPARRRLLIYGSNDYASSLAAAASLLDHHVVVCDPRPVFATTARHPGADEVVVARPAEHLGRQLAEGLTDARTAVVVLTHDPRFDLPVLDLALRAPLGYVGAMGSRQTVERRAQDLRHGGLPQHRLDRLHTPIGLNLGARSPAEVAVSILAELIGATSGIAETRDVVPQRRTTGAIHDARRSTEPADAEPAGWQEAAPSWT